MQRNLGFTPHKVLNSLLQLRFIAVLTQLAVIAYAKYELGMMLPLTPMLSLITALVLWNVATWWRLRPAVLKRWAPTAVEASIHLIIDITVLTGLLYWAGGPTNPFVSLYLVPIAIAATALPGIHAWLITFLCIGGYSLLLWKHVPLPHSHGHGGTDFNLHVLGMWANFIISALLIAAFVSLLATAVRRRDHALNQQREEALRNEQILALGTQAAGTAHELNTPLATMAILIDEMRNGPNNESAQQEDLDVLASQVTHCRDRIRELVEQVTRPDPEATMSATRLLQEVTERWSLLRPETELRQTINSNLQQASVIAGPTLAQALVNLLSNAADASSDTGQGFIHLSASIDNAQLKIEIDDDGAGLTEDQQAKAGDVFFTTKSGGLGMGLVLSHATLERLGGKVTLENRDGGGMRATVLLPLQPLQK